MITYQPGEFRERKEPAPPFQIRVVSYQIDETFYCKVDNVDPGAVIARAEGPTREEAELKAVARAKERLASSAANFGKL